ncbi:hypothetical protein [Streptomyces sp. NPDC059538]|uniref:hypothetical protein n=1 Tax=Streptomyces sp. NPDC059538 TaxID=3346860 RepID=UPI00368B2DE4
MNDIIAGDPAPTNPTALNELRDCWLSDSRERFEAAADAYRAEVQAELADWLVKKAHEYHSLRGKENAARVEVLCRMADKIRRGAVRPGFMVPPSALRVEILTEVADLLGDADETAAALLVDRLLEGGGSRG